MSNEQKNSRAEEILAAATRLFAKGGYDGVSVRDICAELNLNCSIISYYYKGKKGLYLAVLREFFKIYAEALTLAARTASGPREILEAVCRAMAETYKKNPHFVALAARESIRPSPEFREVAEEFKNKTSGVLAEVIRDGQRGGIFRAGLHPGLVAMIFEFLLKGAAAETADGGAISTDDYFNAVQLIFTEGLCASSGEDAPAGRSIGKQSAKPRGAFGSQPANKRLFNT